MDLLIYWGIALCYLSIDWFNMFIDLVDLFDTRIVPSSYIGSFGKKRGANIHVNMM